MPNVWESPLLRQTGRTTRMLSAAVVTSLFRQVVIIAANEQQVDLLRKQHRELVAKFSHEASSPYSSISSRAVEAWASCNGVDYRDLQFKNGEPIFENSAALAQHLLSSASFCFIGELSGYGKWPKPALMFVDHFAQQLIVKNYLQERGY